MVKKKFIKAISCMIMLCMMLLNMANVAFANTNITFGVFDTGMNPISGATVTLTGGVLPPFTQAITNSSGIATLPSILDDSYNYTVTAEGYVDASGIVMVSGSDPQTLVNLTAVAGHNVTFTITNGTTPLQGASVTFKASTQTTDSNGKATFGNVANGMNYPFSVSDSGYHTFSGTLSVLGADVPVPLTLTVNADTLTINTTNPHTGTVGTAYNYIFTASGGTSPYTYTVTLGNLPAGLTLSSAGLVSGTPTASGTSTFTVTATDSASPPANTTSNAFTMTIDHSVGVEVEVESSGGKYTVNNDVYSISSGTVSLNSGSRVNMIFLNLQKDANSTWYIIGKDNVLDSRVAIENAPKKDNNYYVKDGDYLAVLDNDTSYRVYTLVVNTPEVASDENHYNVEFDLEVYEAYVIIANETPIIYGQTTFAELKSHLVFHSTINLDTVKLVPLGTFAYTPAEILATVSKADGDAIEEGDKLAFLCNDGMAFNYYVIIGEEPELSNDATVATVGTHYTVDNDTNNIASDTTAITTDVTVGTFLGNLTKDAGASWKVVSSATSLTNAAEFSEAATKVDGNNLAVGDKLAVMAEDGTTLKVYEIEVSTVTQPIFNNDKIRIGNGNAPSVNNKGNLLQPFYYDTTLTNWYKLTYSSNPLDNAIGVGGDGTNEWNSTGTIEETPNLSNQVIDVSAYTSTGVNKGYGTIASTGDVSIDGKTLEVKNTYTLGQDKSFIKIVSRITNKSGAEVTNLRFWVGTQDDWVGTSDTPTKKRGNLVNGQFAAIENATERASALQISSAATGVLFYSTSEKAHTAVADGLGFDTVYGQDPATASIELTGDSSYALFVRMNDLADEEYEEFTWYYAAGELADLGAVAEEVAEDVGPQATVADAPTAVSALAGNGQAVVDFTAPANDGGAAITGYTVHVYQSGVLHEELSTTGASSPITVSGLTNGTAYTFKVTATNAVGDSTESTASSAVTPKTVPGVPTAVTATAGNGQAAITFTAPVDNGGSAVTGYTVNVYQGGVLQEELSTTGSSSPITVSGLTNGTAYTFKVTATNAVGDSAESAESDAVTPKTVPGAPTNVTATAGNRQATVSFTAPADNGGTEITSYIVTSNPGGITATGSSSPIIVTGLTNGTAYTFTVKAVNAIGNSTDSTTSSAVTPFAPSSGGGGSTPTPAPTPTPVIVKGDVVDNKTGQSVQGVEAQVTTEANGTKTVAVKSEDAILVKEPDGTKTPFSDISKLGFSTTESINSNVSLSADGKIQVKNLANGTETKIAVTYDLGNGQKITIGTIDIKVGSNGDVSLTSTLIDPYGIITDAATGKVISGTDVTLYYANTARNIAAGKTPDSLVALPIIEGFKPNNNKNPQISDLGGAYGFMVFPTSDYYIVATKEGYDQFRSPTIPVQQDIVKLDIKMNQPKIGLTRLAGLNRVDTALEIAKANYTGQVSNVILATADNFPDALAGSVLAYKLKAPILLVGSNEEDQTKVISYLKDSMDPNGTVYILGGNVAVSDTVEGKISASGFSHIKRLGGFDRYETALKIANELDLLTGTPIVLAYGENYPDALSISSAAAAMQYPILLVGKDGISEAVKNKIADIKPIRVYIIGGQAVISTAVEDQVSELTTLGQGAIVRISGVDRYETSLAVANYFNLAGQTVCVATGNNFPDALTGSVYAANANAPIILADVNLSDKIRDYLKTRKSTGVTIFGGEAVISKAIEQELSQMLAN